MREKFFFISMLLIALTGFSLWSRVQNAAFWRFFWIPILCLVVIVSIEAFARDRPDLLPVGLLAVAVAIVQILSLPNSFQLPDYDEYADLNFATTIISTGRWNPSLGVGVAQDYYGWYPVVHFILSIWSTIAGAPLLSVMKYGAPPVMFIALFAVATLVAKRVFSANPAYSAILYVCSVGFMTIEPSRRSISLLIGLLFISFAFQTYQRDRQSRSVTIVEGVLAATLAISDHFTALVVLAASLVGITILRAKRLPTSRTLSMVAVASLAYLAWYIMSAVHVFSRDVTVLSIFLAELTRFQRVVQSGSSNLVGYGIIEEGLVFSAQAVFGTLALIAVIARRKVALRLESLAWGLLGFVTMGGSAILAFSEFNVLSITLYGYAALPVSALGAAVLYVLASPKKGTARRVLAVVLILITFSGSMLIAFSARTLDYPPQQTQVLEEPREFTAQQLLLGQWAAVHVPAGRELLGDRGSYIMLSGLYSLHFVRNYAWPANGLPDNSRSYFVLKEDCYFLCPSALWAQPDKSVESELASYNRILDDGTWQLMTGP